MPQVTYLRDDGTSHVIDVPNGQSLMQAAVDANLDGIVGECGGSAMCATCHVYVVSVPEGASLPEASGLESDMLESAASERTGASRLSCQIVMSPELDGLTVRMPPRQI